MQIKPVSACWLNSKNIAMVGVHHGTQTCSPQG